MIDLYIETRLAYIAGALHTLTAIGRLARDRTFISECDLTHGPGNVDICAGHVVRGPWLKRRVKHAQAVKP